MKDSIKLAVKGGHGNAILYAGALGLLLSDVIPTPADSLYFTLMQKNNKPKHSLRALIPAHHHIFQHKQVHLRTQKTIQRFGGGVYNRFVLVE